MDEVGISFQGTKTKGNGWYSPGGEKAIMHVSNTGTRVNTIAALDKTVIVCFRIIKYT